MVLLTNSSEETAWQAAERIRQRVYDLKIPHMFNESVATNVTISIGLTPLIDDNIEQALARADGALYEAKIKDAILFLPVSFSFARRGIAAPTNSLPCRLQTTNIRNHYHLDLYLEIKWPGAPFLLATNSSGGLPSRRLNARWRRVFGQNHCPAPSSAGFPASG